jgi:hypothetical protein
VHAVCVLLPSKLTESHARARHALEMQIATEKAVGDRLARELDEARVENRRLRHELTDQTQRARQADRVPPLVMRVSALEKTLAEDQDLLAARDTAIRNANLRIAELEAQLAGRATPAESGKGSTTATPDLDQDSRARFNLLDLD